MSDARRNMLAQIGTLLEYLDECVRESEAAAQWQRYASQIRRRKQAASKGGQP